MYGYALKEDLMNVYKKDNSRAIRAGKEADGSSKNNQSHSQSSNELSG